MSFNQSNLHESVASFDRGEEVVECNEKSELSSKEKMKKMLYSFLIQKKIEFMFHPTLFLIDYIIEKNNTIVGNHVIDVRDFLFYNFDGVLKLLDLIEKINFQALKVFKEKVVSQEITLKNFDQKFNELFSNLQESIPHSLSFYDFSPEKMIFNNSNNLNAIREETNMNSYDRLQLVIDEQICLFNIKETETKLLEDLKLIDFIVLSIEVIISRWEIICYILLITYHFFNDGLTCLPLFVYMFIYLIFEEKKSKMFAWKICFVYFVFIAALKMFLHIKLLNPENEENDYVPKIEVNFSY